MNRYIFGAFLAGSLAFATLLPAQDMKQDTQRNKSEMNQQKKKKKDRDKSDTTSNRRMHDYHAPNGVDTLPMHRQAPTPIPDTIHNMH